MSMKLLHDILHNVSIQSIIGDDRVLIKKIVFDSRKCKKDTLFFAIKGNFLDGHEYIDKAISLGSTCIVCEEIPEQLKDNITYIKVSDSRESLALASKSFMYEFLTSFRDKINAPFKKKDK